MKRKGIFLADLHIGALPRLQLEQEIREVLYPFIESHDLDFIVFCGDYFDHKLYLNDENAVFATEAIHTIDQMLKPEAKIRMVYGTKSHDEDQYDTFDVLKDHRDFKVVYHVSEEDLFPGCKTLYLPEEMLVDSEQYYQEFFEESNRYQLVVGHGIIREAMMKAAHAVEEKKGVSRKVPVFRTGELMDICEGMTIFGHYHVGTYIPNTDHQACYVGSFSRWKFGEEQPKGFLYGEYDEDTRSWECEFIENKKAQRYTTMGIGYENKAFTSMEELEQKLIHYDRLVNAGRTDHLRLDFNIPETCENAEYYIEYIKEHFKRNPDVQINITNGYVAKRREENKKEIQEDYEKYSVVFDQNAPLEDQVSYFVDVQYHRKMSSKLVSLYLYNPLNEILESDPQEFEDKTKEEIDE